MDHAGDWATEYDYSNQEWFTGVSPHYTLITRPSIDVVPASSTYSKAARTTYTKSSIYTRTSGDRTQ